MHYQKNPKFFKNYVKIMLPVKNKEGPRRDIEELLIIFPAMGLSRLAAI